MLDVLIRILQFGQESNFPYWKKALACFCQDDTMRTFSLYIVAIECVDSYDFLQDDIISYKSDGGGAPGTLQTQCSLLLRRRIEASI